MENYCFTKFMIQKVQIDNSFPKLTDVKIFNHMGKLHYHIKYKQTLEFSQTVLYKNHLKSWKEWFQIPVIKLTVTYLVIIEGK